MALAEQGLPGEGAPGWEIFDNASGLGMNSFMQQVSRMRALEGELARSILTIDGIDAARVHLVLPDREAFSRTRPEPSASVIVRGRTTQTIGRRQAEAIRALVASAVPDLAPSRVTVLTASGETSWYGFACHIAQHLQNQGRLRARIEPIRSADYPTAAQRPLNSRLNCARLQHDWQISLPNWETALQQCLGDMAHAREEHAVPAAQSV